MGSHYYPKDGHVTYEHEYILLFRKQGDWPKPSDEIKKRSKLTKEQRSRWFRGYWELTPARQSDHVAKFPVELPSRLIRMYSFWGETVLDPFLGSGTTSMAAKRHGRNSLGVELNPEFLSLIKERLGAVDDLFGQKTREGDVEIQNTGNAEIRFEGFPEQANPRHS